MNGEVGGDQRQKDVDDEVVGHGEGEVVDNIEPSLIVATWPDSQGGL